MIGLILSAGAIAVATLMLWPVRNRPKLFLPGVACITVTALALYAYTGAPRLLPHLAQYRAEMAVADARITAANAALEKDAQNWKPWAALGQARMVRGDFSRSAEAYRQAVLLSNGDPQLILQYAKAQIFEANGNVTDAARRGLAIVRTAEPENAEAQYFLALADAQNGKPEKAMPVFKKLYRTLPDDSPIRQLLARQIGGE